MTTWSRCSPIDYARRKLCTAVRAAFVAILFLCALISGPARAAGGPENLLLVVNADSADSVTIANEYAGLRHIAPINILQLRGLPAGPVIKLEAFREQILKPILAAIRARGLADQIDYIIYSAGFPYGVDVSAEMAGRKYPIYITQPASITGLTYLYELALSGSPDYLSLDANWYFRRLKSTHADSPWTEEDTASQSEVQSLVARLQAAQKSTAADAASTRNSLIAEVAANLRALSERHPNDSNLLYDMACMLALQDKPDDAVEMLRAAYHAGWRSAGLTEADDDLKSLRSRSDFKSLMETMRTAEVEMQPARAFHHSVAWSSSGEPAATSGRHYCLSAMLAYVGGPANTLQEATEALRRSASADGTRPAGTIYFMISGDRARTGPREWGFQPAANALKALGVRAEVLSGVLPPGKLDVAGAMVGIAGFDWKGSHSEILPGAFCDHLTSFGAVMTGAGQTLLSEFIRNGAAGASGTVTEPFALQAKFPNAFQHVYYAGGCTPAESFYQSVQGPYQQLLVGDPLCQPWARIPTVNVAGLTAGGTISAAHKLTATVTGGEKVTRLELYVDGIRRQSAAPGTALRLDPTGLSPGAHEAWVVAICGPMDVSGRAILPFQVPLRASTKPQ